MRDLGNVLYISNVRCFIFFSWGYALIVGIAPRLRVSRLRYCTRFAFLWTFYKNDIFSSVSDTSSIKSLFVRSFYGTSTKLPFFLGFILVSERRCSRFSFWFGKNILKRFDPSPLSFYLKQLNYEDFFRAAFRFELSNTSDKYRTTIWKSGLDIKASQRSVYRTKMLNNYVHLRMKSAVRKCSRGRVFFTIFHSRAAVLEFNVLGRLWNRGI